MTLFYKKILLCACLIFALILENQNAESSLQSFINVNRHHFKNLPKCSNTTITPESLENKNISVIEKDLVKRIWISTLSEDVTEIIKEFGSRIIQYIETIDSPTIRYTIFTHAFLIASFINAGDATPKLCAYTKLINESIEQRHTGKNCKDTSEALLNAVDLFPSVCDMLTIGALSDAKCDDVPDVPRFNSKCKGDGFNYDIDTAIKIFGRNIPCKITSLLPDLYKSDKYVDNIVALLFVVVISDEMSYVWELHPLHLSIESLNIVAEDTQQHCCRDRRTRLDKLCVQHNTAVKANVKKAIEYLFDDDFNQ